MFCPAIKKQNKTKKKEKKKENKIKKKKGENTAELITMHVFRSKQMI